MPQKLACIITDGSLLGCTHIDEEMQQLIGQRSA